ncbi:hypothetical protein ZHAS_00007929 [Anopheles sinensis]|uniref:Uncharacterized protein n=1 Tax=Anopheles sinensis TaxID=74873 RepID=A0A084VR56_ANOSI|nr:hypothetical protein ZHAS_00007929 [Anopheles sinensis]
MSGSALAAGGEQLAAPHGTTPPMPRTRSIIKMNAFMRKIFVRFKRHNCNCFNISSQKSRLACSLQFSYCSVPPMTPSVRVL